MCTMISPSPAWYPLRTSVVLRERGNGRERGDIIASRRDYDVFTEALWYYDEGTE